MDIDFFDLKLEAGDTILMCSDGLSNMVDDRKMEEIISGTSTEMELTEKAKYSHKRGQP